MGSKVAPVFNINTQQLKGSFAENRDNEIFSTKITKIDGPDVVNLKLFSFNFMAQEGAGNVGNIIYYIYDDQDVMTGFLKAEFKHANILDNEAVSFYQNKPYVKVDHLFDMQNPWFNIENQLTIMTRLSEYNASMKALFALLSFMIDSDDTRFFEKRVFLIMLNRLNSHLVDQFTLLDEETGAKRLPAEVEQELDDIINREPDQVTVELAKVIYNMLFKGDYAIELPIIYDEFEVLVVKQKLVSIEKIAGAVVKKYEYNMPVIPQPTYVEVKMSDDINNFSVLLKVN